VPLNIEIIESKFETTTNNRAPIIQQMQIQTQGAQPKARGKATTCVPPHQSKQAAPANPDPPQQGHDNITKRPHSNRKKRRPRGECKAEAMAAKPSGVYLPPHLRKRGAALPETTSETKVEVRLGDILGPRSPPTSVKSQVEKPIQNEVLP
jgi:hypothetical protein